MSPKTLDLLRTYAARYETADFLKSDPSWFMHQVDGDLNQETMAFVASGLSYGSRKQFFPKIQFLLDCSKGDFYEWVRSGQFAADIPDDNATCFYRLYTFHTIHVFLSTLQRLLNEHGSLKAYVSQTANDGESAVAALCRYFKNDETTTVVPKDTSSACKRVCMFLRWMVRSGSPVDLGLWSDIIDRRTLIMPLDTHVLQESMRLGLTHSRTATMSAAQRLTTTLREVFPEDPLKADFALFGYGVNREQ